MCCPVHPNAPAVFQGDGNLVCQDNKWGGEEEEGVGRGGKEDEENGNICFLKKSNRYIQCTQIFRSMYKRGCSACACSSITAMGIYTMKQI